MVYWYNSIFFHHVSKRRNIGECLFAYLENGVFSKWVLVLWEEIASVGAISCPYEMTAFYMGGNYDNDRVASPELYLSIFNSHRLYFAKSFFLQTSLVFLIFLGTLNHLKP